MASLSVPPVLTSPRHDAIALHRAFKGFGCDSTTVINILAHRDAKAMLLWVLDPVGRDAAILNQSLNGDITDLRAATEVICSRTPSQLQIMKQTYRARFGCYLEQDITERTYGDHHKLLLAYLGIPRAEVDMQYIKAEYHKKYKRSLADAIHSETSGNYRTFVLSLVGRDR
uniref:Annexin D5 n=1 Tax=Aegilops tauschii TaxID=37682 RepID=R7W532_AEGTA